MANTVIQLKYSDITNIPISLETGEAAYSNTSDTLFIGLSGGQIANVGGVFYTEQIDNATDNNTASTIVKRDASGNFSAGTITATLSGTATSADTWSTARTLGIDGDATGSVSLDGSADANITLTLADSGVTATTYGDTSNIPQLTVDSKGRVTSVSNVSINIPSSYQDSNVVSLLASFGSNTISTSGSVATGDMTITGNLTVTGETTYANTTTVNLGDNIITLNADIPQGSAPSVDAGIEVDRGSSANVGVIWNETSDKWTFTNDGSTYSPIADADRLDSAFAQANTGVTDAATAQSTADGAYSHANGAFNAANTAQTHAEGAFTQANTNASSITTTNSRVDSAYAHANGAFDAANTKFSSSGGTISGDATVTGNLTVQGQTTYVNSTTVNFGDNIFTVNAAINQASAPTLNAGMEVDRGSSANVSLIWNETDDKWTFTNDGSTYSPIADADRLDSAYSQANTATTNAATAQTHAEGAFDQANTNATNITTAQSTADGAYDHANGAFVQANTNASNITTTNSRLDSAYNHANGAFAQANTDVTNVSVSAGTYGSATAIPSVTLAANGRITAITTNSISTDVVSDTTPQLGGNLDLNGNDITGTGNIDITGDITASGTVQSQDMVITGNLTVSGETTYANTTTVNLGDNIITLNADIPQGSAPSENAGIEVDRGSSANVGVIWNETDDVWTFTNDGSTYHQIASNTYVDAAFAQANTANSFDYTTISLAFTEDLGDQSGSEDLETATGGNTSLLTANGWFGNTVVVPSIFIESNGRISTVVNTDIRVASTTETGIVQLYDGVDSNSTTLVSTANSTKTAYDYAQAAFNAANTASSSSGAYDHANGAFDAANTAQTTASSSYAHANGAFNAANTAQTHAEGAFTQANTNASNITTAQNTADGAYAHANGAFDKANTAITTSGGTISGDLSVTGNLVVSGNTVTTDVETITVQDSLVKYANNNLADALDIGFYGTYNDGTQKYATFFRDASDSGKFKILVGGTTEPDAANTVNPSGFSTGTLVANIEGGTVSNLSAAIGVADGGTGATTLTNNGVLLGQGTSAVTAVSSSTEGHVLQINSSGVPVFGHLSGGSF